MGPLRCDLAPRRVNLLVDVHPGTVERTSDAQPARISALLDLGRPVRSARGQEVRVMSVVLGGVLAGCGRVNGVLRG